MILKNAKGQALVETALALFLLMLLVFGIVEFGRAFYLWNTLNNAARAGVRQAVVTPNITASSTTLSNHAHSPDCTAYSGANADVYRTICSSIYAGIQDRTHITATIEDLTTTNSGIQRGDTIRVSVIWDDFRSVTTLFPITNQLSGRSSMRYEY